MQERLQKLIAEAGIASRRKAEQMILDGLVVVNGNVVRELGTKADPQVDHIRVEGKLINEKIVKRELVYILLNKPRGYLSSNSDPENRPLAVDLLPPNLRKKVHTVGRLDFNTEGLLILTNDGNLTDRVARAGRVPKVYHAKVKGHPTEALVERLRRGIPIEGRRTAPAQVELLDATRADNAWYGVTLVEGRNQQIRKMFDAINHGVVKLRRVQIGAVTDAGLRPGAWRELTPSEVQQLLTPNKRPRKHAAAATAAGEDAAPRAPRVAARVGKPGGPTRRDEVVKDAKPTRRGTQRPARAKSAEQTKRRPKR